jgi:flagellar biosynthetic protein FliP
MTGNYFFTKAASLSDSCQSTLLRKKKSLNKLLPLFSRIKYRVITFFFFLILFQGEIYAQAKGGQIPIPKINLGIDAAKNPEETSVALMILFLLTLLSLAPALIMMMTSFAKIVIVFDFIRRALSLQNMPPNQVMVGLALFITLFVMTPTIKTINESAFQPYLDKKIKTNEFFERSMTAIRGFMIHTLERSETSNGMEEVALFLKLGKLKNVKSFDGVPTYILIPAFMLSEIKKAFWIGILLFIPFIVIDMVVASTLMSMGMIMLPPVMISLPFKIVLFILVDGWNLVTRELVRSYI